MRAPRRVPLRPEVLALVVETLPVAVHDDAERDAVQAGGDAAVEPRRPGVDADRVKPAFLPGTGRAGLVQPGQDVPVVVGRAADHVVVGCVSPVAPQPADVRLEAAAGTDHRASADLV